MMSHEVETMAYTNEVPWHGLGHYVAEAPTVKKMLKLAQLDWRVERRPMFHDAGNEHGENLQEVEGFAALVRDKDNAVLDVVGSRYKPAQNEDVFEFFTEFVEAGGAKMETAGSLKGGRYVWGLASLNASFKMRGDDEVKGYLLVGSPHEQGKSLVIKFTTVRVVCNNTLTLALRKGGSEFRMTHRLEFNERMIENAKDTLGIARDQLGEFEANARKIQKLKLTEKDQVNILADIYMPGVDKKELHKDLDNNLTPRMKTLLDVNKRAPGAQEGNGWGLLNAVTYYSDHLASRSADARLTHAWMGRSANHKETVLQKLLELA